MVLKISTGRFCWAESDLAVLENVQSKMIHSHASLVAKQPYSRSSKKRSRFNLLASKSVKTLKHAVICFLRSLNLRLD